jgi:hypothetical protein
MPEDQIEKEAKEKTVEIGEWFNPFINYDDQPYEINREKYAVKEFPVFIKPIGKTTMSTIWDRESEWDGDALIYLPFGQQEIKMENFPKFEEKIESKLVDIGLSSDENQYLGKLLPPYQLEIKTPDEQIYFNRFINYEDELSNPHTISFYWQRQQGNNNQKKWLLFPEVENILEKIQMRIVPITGENNE